MNTSGHILIIEDDVIFCNTLIESLAKDGFEVIGVNDGYQALEEAKKKPFELIIADIRLPGEMDGIEVLNKIKKISNYPSKLIIMTAYADKDAPIRAIKLGVDDYIYKPFRLEEFLHSVRKIIQIFRLQKDIILYQELSNRDGLTTLYNHRFFYESIKREVERAERYEHTLSLLMIDIDNFKDFNEKYGYLSGDMILKSISDVLIRSIRSVDLPFRYGGEEFAIILPETDNNGAVIVADRIRKEIEEASFGEVEVGNPKLTLSIGIANFPEDVTKKENLISCADKALYKAKTNGKNKVYLWNKNEMRS